MRSRAGLFWQSLFLTLLVLLPMVGAVSFFSMQREQQQQIKQAAAGKGGVAVEAGAQNTLRLLAAVQGETPAFVLVRLDAPARTITLCGLPEQTVVEAPGGSTSLSACYMTAGPARAAELLGDTLGYKPDGYYAATSATLAALAGEETAARFDTAAVLDKAQRTTMGYAADSVVELTAENAAAFIQGALKADLSAVKLAELRAAVWAAFLRQNPDLLAGLTAAMRKQSSKTLTNLTAQDLYTLEDTLNYLHSQTAATVEYTVLPGDEQPVSREYLLNSESKREAKVLLG